MGEFKIGAFTYYQNEKGEWLYKADNFRELKKDGSLKKKYKDLPRYDVIYEWEKEAKEEFKKTLINSVKEAQQLLNIK